MISMVAVYCMILLSEFRFLIYTPERASLPGSRLLYKMAAAASTPPPRPPPLLFLSSLRSLSLCAITQYY